LGISLEEPRVVMKYLGRIFIHIQRWLHLHGVKIINHALYIDLDSRKSKHHMGQKQADKKRDKNIATTTKKIRDHDRH
jgi:hypothetical protein